MIGIIREIVQKIKKIILYYFKFHSKTEDPCLQKCEKGDDIFHMKND